jgi:prepilin-type N-terminal cleavage/methylation domain-containing protein
MLTNRKAFTLVEILVTLAVSSIIMVATYGAYDMVKTQYHKNMDIANMHTSGRAIMRIIERDVRMAGFEYRDKDAKITYGSISNPLTIKDSGNKCCDEVTVIYDYFDEASKKAERIRIRYWTEPHTSNKGSRHRLYKQKDILGRNGSVLTNPGLGRKEVMADYIEDLQIVNINNITNLYVLDSAGRKVYIFDPSTKKYTGQFDLGRNVGYFGMGADGNLYVLDSAGRKVYIFDPSTKKYTGQFDLGRNVGYFALRNQRTGQESLVTIDLTLRTKNQYGKDRQFKKKDYHGGNFKIDKTDKYKRDTFSTTVLVRNLAL